jgi:hypothetical protein
MANLIRAAKSTFLPGILLALAPGCASRLGYQVSPARTHAAPPALAQAHRLDGRVGAIDGSWLELGDFSDRPAVLVFSQDTCAVCGHEADTLRDALAPAAQAPTNIHLITILVGAVAQDAQDWKQEHRVPWTVATDPDASVFAQYCVGTTVPCNVVFLPGQGIVLSRNAAMTPDDLKALTGPWGD